MNEYISASEVRQHQKEIADSWTTLFFRHIERQLRNMLNINLDMRPTIDEVMMQCAFNIAQRSTCIRRKVGCIVTTNDRLQVLGYGYNGNAKGLPNHCDDVTPGDCGCIHAELNALLKAPGTLPNKILYTTTAPCLDCAKLILNSNVIEVIYHEAYRINDGVELLHDRNVIVRKLQLNLRPWHLEHNPGNVSYTGPGKAGVPFEP